MHCICADFGGDSSSHFPCRVWTDGTKLDERKARNTTPNLFIER